MRLTWLIWVAAFLYIILHFVFLLVFWLYIVLFFFCCCCKTPHENIFHQRMWYSVFVSFNFSLTLEFSKNNIEWASVRVCDCERVSVLENVLYVICIILRIFANYLKECCNTFVDVNASFLLKKKYCRTNSVVRVCRVYVDFESHWVIYSFAKFCVCCTNRSYS